MSNLRVPDDWREGRRQAARQAIVRSAWTLVEEKGLAGLSCRSVGLFATGDLALHAQTVASGQEWRDDDLQPLVLSNSNGS